MEELGGLDRPIFNNVGEQYRPAYFELTNRRNHRKIVPALTGSVASFVVPVQRPRYPQSKADIFAKFIIKRAL